MRAFVIPDYCAFTVSRIIKENVIMKNNCKRILSLTLTLLMLISAIPLSTGIIFSSSASEVGNIIEFGSYPQSEVTDSAVISAIDNMWYEGEIEFVSYDYYFGFGTSYDEGLETNFTDEYMKYADVTIDGVKYRTVMIDRFRPNYTHLDNTAGNTTTYQDDNGFETSTMYYFKYEPLKWRVLDPATGLMMCESIIDSQPYLNQVYFSNDWSGGCYYNNVDHTIYANNYAESSIRAWLNADFYNTAFSAEEKTSIKNTAVDNTRIGTFGDDYSCQNTTDKVFLLSQNDVTNTAYGFTNDTYSTTRHAKATAYAKAQNVQVESNASYLGNSMWFLRTPGSSDYLASKVSFDGRVTSDMVFDTYVGIRPAICAQLHSHSFTEYVYNDDATCLNDGTETATCTCGETDTRTKTNSALGHAWGNGTVTTDATCTAEGIKTFTCTRCNATKTEAIEAINHAGAYDVEATDATCTATGLTAGRYCPDCETWLTAQETVGALGHAWNNGSITTDATCNADGVKTYTCTRCAETKTETIAKTGHYDEDNNGICDTCGASMEAKACSCNCHKTGILNFFFRIFLFFQKLFGLNKTCACGVNHY